jgi:hypothetical protein
MISTPSEAPSVAGDDLLKAIDFAQRRFDQWQQDGRIRQLQWEAVTKHYAERRQGILEAQRTGKPVTDPNLPPALTCWSCQAATTGASLCPTCGAPLDTPPVKSVRYFTFLRGEIVSHQGQGRLLLSQSHTMLAEIQERVAALQARLEQERIPPVRAVPPPLPPAPAVPRRSLLEILLDPRSIQWLLAFGGALMVLGLVIYLWIAGVFQNAVVVAVILGAATLTLLAGGWATIRFTRYQTAGRALTLLACLVLPLNLWFYDAQGLVTLSDGGHLWLAALVCCALYAASALVLRDPLFVYVLSAGVALTGLLLLADRSVEHFWEVASPAALLVALGLIALHAERAFPEGDGPFSRPRFGLAFFWSGQALLGAGLLVLLGGQLFGWLHPLMPAELLGAMRTFGDGLDAIPRVVNDPALQTLALFLVLAGTYAYAYSDVVVRRVGVYIYLATFTVLWAEVLAVALVVNLYGLTVGLEAVILILAVTALAANVLQATLARQSAALARTGPPLGLFLSTLPVLLGVFLHLRTTATAWPHTFHYEPTWWYVAAMLATAVSCRVGAYLYREQTPWLSAVYFFGTAAATLAGAAGLLSVLRTKDWSVQAPILMTIPILYLVAARLYRGRTEEAPLVWVAHSATAVMVLAVLGAALRGDTSGRFEVVTGHVDNVLLGCFWLEAAVFYGLAAAFRRQGLPVYLATAAACGALWQFLNYYQIDSEFHTVAFALLGFGLLLAYRFAVPERLGQSGLADAVFRCANALMSLAFVAVALLALSRLALTQAELAHVGGSEWIRPLHILLGLLVLTTAVSALAVWLVAHRDWRRWYVIATLGQCLLGALVLYKIVEWSPWQKLEIFCVVLGLFLLGVGHLGWYREQERQSDLVSLSLFLGSVLVGLPLAVAVIHYRSQPTPVFHFPDELGLLSASILLFVSGLLFRIKSTTLLGGLLGLVYLVSLALYVRLPDMLKTAAVWIAVGGLALFACGLLLSIYRDRLLALPDKIKRREGIFRVLTWR